MELSEKQLMQKKLMYEYLKYLNENSKNQYVLKGGTGLMFGYQLNRFSEDIDLDATKGDDFFKISNNFAKKNNIEMRIGKDTDYVKRVFLKWDNSEYIPGENEPKPLKIETSLRKKTLLQESIVDNNGIKIYDIDTISEMKLQAYNDRNKIRDLYDLCFIVNERYDLLSKRTIASLQNGISFHGLEKCDFLINTQEDELIKNIDKDSFMNKCIDMFEKLEIIDEGVSND